jgi:hypothetical protein
MIAQGTFGLLDRRSKSFSVRPLQRSPDRCTLTSRQWKEPSVRAPGPFLDGEPRPTYKPRFLSRNPWSRGSCSRMQFDISQIARQPGLGSVCAYRAPELAAGRMGGRYG